MDETTRFLKTTWAESNTGQSFRSWLTDAGIDTTDRLDTNAPDGGYIRQKDISGIPRRGDKQEVRWLPRTVSLEGMTYER